MISLLRTLNRLLDSGHAVVRATIAMNQGSTPRGAGSMLLHAGEGGLHGTVGGGLVEARVIQAAEGILAQPGQPAPSLLDFDLTGEIAAGADMICGGKMRVLVERIQPGAQAQAFSLLERQMEQGKAALLATSMSGAGRCLLLEDATVAGDSMDSATQAALRQAGKEILAPALCRTDQGDWFLEPWTPSWRLIIAGAGHVSRPTAQIASMVGFRVEIVDDRPEFANRERFPSADVIAVRDLDTCLEGRDLGPRDAVVIVTRGHVHDGTVLAQALRTRAGYIGMIGSRRKRDALYARLRQQGVTEAQLATVRCPIGLDIDAETPEEIAVSILAELIRVRAGAEQA